MHKKLKIRSMVIALFFTLLFLGLVSRMYYVQVVEASMLLQKAERNWADEDILPAKRGTIVDRKGRSLAEDGAAFTVAVNPKIIADKDEPNLANEISHGLAAILGPNAGADVAILEKKIYGMTTKLKQNGKDLAIEVEVNPEGWKIDGEIKLKIDELANSIREKYNFKKNANIGLYTKEVIKRYYPYNSLASQVLGYVNKEGVPIGGIESSLDTVLKGTPGKLTHEKDTSGVEIPDSKVSYTPAVMGNTVKLTIDQNIQYFTETAIQKTMAQFHPKSMTAIVVNPKTMEILAMANAPTFNPNRYWEANKNQLDYKNLSISDSHEPGSTFKLVTLAGAVQENLFDPNDKYQSGMINIKGTWLKDHNGGQGWGKISYMQGLLYSSNVAFVKLGYEKLGVDRLKAYINNFGFGKKTGIDLPNEVSGTVGQMKYPVEAATATFGQGQVVVTAIQQIAAYAAIANGGKLMWPHVVKEIEDSQTKEIVQSFEPKVVKQAVTAETAKQTSLYLEQVVANQETGTGRKGYISGYRIAGKTGTAQIVEPGAKTYKDGSWLISFIGYAPVEDPQIMIAIIAEEPDIGGDYHRGSEVWAPAFRDVMSQSLRYMGITSTAVDAKTVSEVPVKTIPNLSGSSLTVAKNLLNQAGLEPQIFGNGAKIVKQFPLPGTEISMSRPVYVTTEAKITQVPDFTGKSLRDSLEICSLLELQCKVSGEGYVTKQVVTGAGAQQVVKFELHPLSAPAAEASGESKENPDAASKSTAESN